MGINHITLIGTLTKAPESRKTQAGISQLTFEITVPRSPRPDGTPSEAADTFKVIAWRTLADTLAETLQQGDLISLLGRINTRTIEREGQRMKVVEIEAQGVEQLKGGTPAPAAPRAPREQSEGPIAEPIDDVYDHTDEIPF